MQCGATVSTVILQCVVKPSQDLVRVQSGNSAYRTTTESSLLEKGGGEIPLAAKTSPALCPQPRVLYSLVVYTGRFFCDGRWGAREGKCGKRVGTCSRLNYILLKKALIRRQVKKLTSLQLLLD
jgi:hypothetical protein